MKKLLMLFCCLFLVFNNANAQTKNNNPILLTINKEKLPDIYIDGNKQDYKAFEILDQSTVTSVKITQGKTDTKVIVSNPEIEKYNRPNGVIEIFTKTFLSNNNKPLLIIDGKIEKNKDINQITPDDIQSINVIKGEKALNEYNAPNGVIIIKTKKK